jgi:hypothetical protein
MKESKNWVSNTPKHQCRQERKKGIAGEMKEWKEQMKEMKASVEFGIKMHECVRDTAPSTHKEKRKPRITNRRTKSCITPPFPHLKCRETSTVLLHPKIFSVGYHWAKTFPCSNPGNVLQG